MQNFSLELLCVILFSQQRVSVEQFSVQIRIIQTIHISHCVRTTLFSCGLKQKVVTLLLDNVYGDSYDC